MAGKSTISITFKLDGDGKGFKDLAKDADGLRRVITSTMSEAQQLKGNVINFAALATGIEAAHRSFSQLQSGMRELADAYAVQEVAETKLATVMRQRMGVTDAEIQSIKELASAQQEAGVIGDEVQLSGAQQMATFLNEKQSLDTLIPAMNNLLAQQKGLNASTSDAVSVGNMLGKVMMGEVGALKEVGISFTEAEANVLKYGTEQERAAMLAQVIQNNVGDMNAELAQTDSGKQQQLVNALGDIKEQVGGLVNGALPFVTMAAQAGEALSAVTTLVTGVRTLSATMYASTKAFVLSTAAVIKNKVATLATAAAQKAVTVATNAWKAAQAVLNMILTANPIGLIITAVGLLVTAIITAYNNCESFRKIVDGVWEAIKPLANAIMNGLAKAFEWLVEKCKEAWEWLKNILGLGGKTVEVAVNVSKPKAAPTIDLGETQKKYANMGTTTKATPKSRANTGPVYDEAATTLKGYYDNIEVLRRRLQTASLEQAAALNEEIAFWQEKIDLVENAGAAVEANNDLINENAATIKDMSHNVDILQGRLQNATSIEEAAVLNKEIAFWQAKIDAMENAGAAAEAYNEQINENAATIKDMSHNIDILDKRLQTASIEEAASINRQKDAWEAKIEAIKNAGREAEKTGVSVGKTLRDGWGTIKGVAGGVESVTEALRGNGGAWERICSLVDGFLGLYDGIKKIIGIIDLLSGASLGHAAAKGEEAGAEAGAAAAAITASATTAAASTDTIVANKLETASWKELAAAKYMAAHAYIPFAGFGIAAGYVAAMEGVVTAAGIPMLADGGVATGPTLAMVGEYAGAGSNPEVIAPLDKLRDLLAEPAGWGDLAELEFKLSGRNLIAVISRVNNLKRRS